MADENNSAISRAVEYLFKIVNSDDDDSDDADFKEFEDSDDEMFWKSFRTYLEYYHRRRNLPKLKNYVENIVQAYTEKEFQSRFRMRPSTFNFLMDTIKSSLIRKSGGCQMISPEKQLLIALWRMVTPDSYRSLCPRFDVSFAVTLLSVRRVVKALVAIAKNFIVWPNPDKVNDIWNGFEATSGFPNVIGAMDGTHFNITKPHKDSEVHVNRKGHHSIQLQAVCDSQTKFLHCYTGEVGSLHDARVFRLSEVNDHLNNPLKFPNNCHLVGDATYPIHENFLTPYRDDCHLSIHQKNYNFCHSSARIAIELLEKRFRSLLTVLDMTRTDLIPDFIIARCILHNICVLKSDELKVDENIVGENEDNNENFIYIQGREVAAEGAHKRDAICYQLPMRHI